jgi:flagellar hook-associated protein 1 FlgK
MGNLFGSLLSTASSMRVFERALATVQNNTVNVGTAGYAKQRQGFEALRFEPDRNVVGGVAAGALQSFRDLYSERNVQNRASLSALEDQRAASLASIETIFPITEGAGVPAAINNFFAAASQLTVSPNDSSSRRIALDRANDVAFTFRRTANVLFEERGNTQTTLRSTVDQINALGARIRDINASRRSAVGSANDPGSEARMYAALEELATLVDFDMITDSSGGVSVYLGGQSLLVIGDRQYPIATDIADDQARILDSDGVDITRQLYGGKVSGLVDIFNNKIPGYMADLNTLAGAFADNVNQTLAQGLDQNGNPPTQDLFAYDPQLGAAFTMTTADLAPDELALAAATKPGGNGNAIQLAELAKVPVLNGQTLQQFYGSAVGRLGRDLQNAKTVSEVQGDLLAQARQLRQEVQGVSLDEEATLLVQYQRSYQAAAQIFATINAMTETVLNAMGR